MIRRASFGFGVVAPLVAGVVMAATTSRTPLVLQNVTPSLPLGLYVRSPAPVRAGAIVALRQPAVARPYLIGLGFPREALLIKRVVATAGDPICSRPGSLVRAGQRVFPRRDRDGAGRPLPAWHGCRELAFDELMVAGDTPGSFDSRYFGPVRRGDIVGVFARLP